MKGFKFKLQSVLESRKKKLEDRQIEFAEVNKRLNNEKKSLEFLCIDLQQTTIGLETVINSGTIDHTFIFCHQNYIDKLKNDIKRQNKLIEKTEKELEEKNKLLIEALKDKTIMEKLREKALEDFKTNIERKDLINIDEIATNRHKKTG